MTKLGKQIHPFLQWLQHVNKALSFEQYVTFLMCQQVYKLACVLEALHLIFIAFPH